MAVKYALYLAAKVIGAIGLSYLLQSVVVHSYHPPPVRPGFPRLQPFLGDMAFTFGTLAVALVTVGLIWLSWWDQKRRCRTCLRKLIMPVDTGSWANIVMLGRPSRQLICPYGHGTLSEEKLHVMGHRPPLWQSHDDNIWKELESYGPSGSSSRRTGS